LFYLICLTHSSITAPDQVCNTVLFARLFSIYSVDMQTGTAIHLYIVLYILAKFFIQIYCLHIEFFWNTALLHFSIFNFSYFINFTYFEPVKVYFVRWGAFCFVVYSICVNIKYNHSVYLFQKSVIKKPLRNYVLNLI
jgi:hypothetical protein